MEVLPILTREWKPLQVKESSEGYEDYIGSLCNLLILKKPLADIIDYLWEVETQVMGLDGNFARTEEIAKRLCMLNGELLDPATSCNVHKRNVAGYRI
jgi:hypothetical protein